MNDKAKMFWKKHETKVLVGCYLVGAVGLGYALGQNNTIKGFRQSIETAKRNDWTAARHVVNEDGSTDIQVTTPGGDMMNFHKEAEVETPKVKAPKVKKVDESCGS